MLSLTFLPTFTPVFIVSLAMFPTPFITSFPTFNPVFIVSLPIFPAPFKTSLPTSVTGFVTFFILSSTFFLPFFKHLPYHCVSSFIYLYNNM